MNKNELISAVATKSGLNKGDAATAIDAVFASITDGLKTGEEIRLIGFGTFYINNRAATKGRNPRTGEPMDIKASKQVKFRVGKNLKESVNS